MHAHCSLKNFSLTYSTIVIFNKESLNFKAAFSVKKVGILNVLQ